MNASKDRRLYAYWLLGRAGIPFDQVGPMLGYAARNARGNQKGIYPVPETNMVIVYHPGMDGWDSWYDIEGDS